MLLGCLGAESAAVVAIGVFFSTSCMGTVVSTGQDETANTGSQRPAPDGGVHSPGSGGAAGATGSGGAVPVSEDAGLAAGDAETTEDPEPIDDAGAGDPGPDALPTDIVGPIIAPDCPEDPTQGFTEYTDTFKVQHPYDLQPTDRYTLENGIYTIWVLPHDKPHEPGNTTAPRTEFRWSNFGTGEHLFSADVLYESPMTHTCIFQVKNAGPPTGVYLRVDQGDLHQLGDSPFLTGMYDKWFNLKVAFDTTTATGRVWINNCLKATVHVPRGDGAWYFKNGTYTCDAPICRDRFKNIRLYQR
jgi:hypothetical protein